MEFIKGSMDSDSTGRVNKRKLLKRKSQLAVTKRIPYDLNVHWAVKAILDEGMESSLMLLTLRQQTGLKRVTVSKYKTPTKVTFEDRWQPVFRYKSTKRKA